MKFFEHETERFWRKEVTGVGTKQYKKQKKGRKIRSAISGFFVRLTRTKHCDIQDHHMDSQDISNNS